MANYNILYWFHFMKGIPKVLSIFIFWLSAGLEIKFYFTLNIFFEVWCCVDKDGILSLPNPCAEKVFFLKSRRHKLKEELAGQAKARKESTCTWTSEISKVSSSQDGQESSEGDDEDEDEDEDDDVSFDYDSAGKSVDSFVPNRYAMFDVHECKRSPFSISTEHSI